MNPVRKAHATRRHRQTRRWIVAVFVLIIIVTLITVAYVWYPKNEPNAVNNDPAFKAFTNHYLGIMENLNLTETKAQIALQLDPTYNQTDLFAWEQSKLTFVQDPEGWFEDPTQILNSGKGICVQWSIVYVSACLALGYQSRLVVAADTANWNFIHVWAEDYYNGTWVHVDPSDKVWNNPSRYQSWDWGTAIGSGVKIYAFKDGTFQDVTSAYSAHSS
jgi:transglutaminase-like putative cysteine protease